VSIRGGRSRTPGDRTTWKDRDRLRRRPNTGNLLDAGRSVDRIGSLSDERRTLVEIEPDVELCDHLERVHGDPLAGVRRVRRLHLGTQESRIRAGGSTDPTVPCPELVLAARVDVTPHDKGHFGFQRGVKERSERST